MASPPPAVPSGNEPSGLTPVEPVEALSLGMTPPWKAGDSWVSTSKILPLIDEHIASVDSRLPNYPQRVGADTALRALRDAIEAAL